MGKTRPRDIGTAAESAVLKVIREYFPEAERSPLRGGLDQGDIMNTPYVWEVKGGHAAENASDGQIEKWLEETFVEIRNRVKDAQKRNQTPPIDGYLLTKRKGIGVTNADRWWCHWYMDGPKGFTYPVRATLRDVLDSLTIDPSI